MTHIARAYDDYRDASAAADELRSHGLTEIAIFSAPQDAPTAEDMAAAIRKAGFSHALADACAARVRPGGSVVVANAPFGAGMRTTQILESHGPGETITPATATPRRAASPRQDGTADDPAAAPLSAALHVPVLANPTPAASLTAPKTLSAMLGIPELIRSGSSFPLLTESQAPFSSLAVSQTPFSSLSANQKPWSKLSRNQRGHASLIDNPAPFSSLLGLPVLWRAHAATSASASSPAVSARTSHPDGPGADRDA